MFPSRSCRYGAGPVPGQAGGAGGAPLDISREDIAQYVGTATESLIRTLSDFKPENLIDIREGKIRIADVQKLQNMIY